MRLIDADIYVTIRLYDDEHEEYRDERMTIADCLDRFTEEGCPTESNPKSKLYYCKDKLPDEEVDVLAYFEPWGEWDVARLIGKNANGTPIWLYDGSSLTFGSVITTWMPLPESYKGVDDEEST